MSRRRVRAVSNDYEDTFSTSYEDNFFVDGIISPETERQYMREAHKGNNLSSFLDVDEQSHREEEGEIPPFTQDQFPSLGGGLGSAGSTRQGSLEDEEDDLFGMDDEEVPSQEPSKTFSSFLDMQPQTSGNKQERRKQPKSTPKSSGLTNRKRLPTKKARKTTNSFTSTQQLLQSVPKSSVSLPTAASKTEHAKLSGSMQEKEDQKLSTPSLTYQRSSSSSSSSKDMEDVSDDELEEGGPIHQIVEEHKAKILAGEGKPLINILIAGHVDAGKSTLMGHLLVKLGIIEQRTVHRHQREAKEAGKGSFFLAWVLDEDSSEREAGITMDVGHKAFETEERVVRILDAPGHHNFIPAMIEGASMADAALLVIPSSTNEFEDSFKPKAQTKEHATVLRAMGIKQLVVVINKMDNAFPPWSYSRFLQIKEEVGAFLVSIGFKERQIRFVPVSGLTGANLLERIPQGTTPSFIRPIGHTNEEKDDSRIESGEEEGDWSWIWSEEENCPSLVEAINDFRIPPRPTQQPLRCVVSEVLSTPSSNAQGNYVLMIQILQGVLREGRSLLSLPRGVLVQPQSILPDDILAHTASGGSSAGHSNNASSSSRKQEANKMTYAFPGNMVCVVVQGDEGDITVGDVLCRGPSLPHLLHDGDSFSAKVFAMDDIFPPLTLGSNLQLHIHGVEVCVRISELVELLTEGGVASSTNQKNKKKKRKKKLKAILGGQNALIRIRVEGPLVVEPFENCKRLGSGVLRRRGETVAVCTIVDNSSEL